jgi:hypothetical protein
MFPLKNKNVLHAPSGPKHNDVEHHFEKAGFIGFKNPDQEGGSSLSASRLYMHYAGFGRYFLFVVFCSTYLSS